MGNERRGSRRGMKPNENDHPRRCERRSRAVAQTCAVALLIAPASLERPIVPAMDQGQPQDQRHRSEEAENKPDSKSHTPAVGPDLIGPNEQKGGQSKDNWLWNEWTSLFPETRLTDALLTLFTFGQVWVGLRQARILRQQARIAEETREIAFAALGRPYVFFECVSHSLEDWRSGKDYLRFIFRFANHGTSPAIAKDIIAYVFLSYGPGRENRSGTSIIKEFPRPEELTTFLRWGFNVSVKLGEGDEWSDWKRGKQLNIPPGGTSVLFSATLSYEPIRPPKDRWPHWRRIYEETADSGLVCPWLSGRIEYMDAFGRWHWTAFTLRGHADGSAIEEGDPPYNERT
jgi:hypothetical protein